MATNSAYQINKGINKSIEFKGLKAQYIWYLAIGILVLLIAFATMYIIGLPPFLCMGIILIGGACLVIKVYGMSNRYGEHGMMKTFAKRYIPKRIKIKSRKCFQFKKRD